MKKKILWLGLSFLLVVSLVLASCAPAVVGEQEEEEDVVVDHPPYWEIPIVTTQRDPFDKITPGFSGNPVIRHMFTADPAALVYNDTFYIYTGHDEQLPGVDGFLMKDWHVFSSTNMIDWEDHGPVLSIEDFSWAKQDAWAGECVYNKGKFWWYVPMSHKTIGWFSIAVAVADHPTGPFVDALGHALITDNTANSVELNIDPTVFVDDDGQVYLYWGSWGECRMVKLKDNMIELDGPVTTVTGLRGFHEAAYLHKRDDIYYLSYAAGYPSTTEYATSESPEGPWVYRGRINNRVSSSTNHHSIVEYKGKWYFVYHNAGLLGGGDYRRSVCIDTMHYNDDGTINTIIQTTKGIPTLP